MYTLGFSCLFFNLEYYFCIIAALIIYSVYLFLFNTKLLPSFDQAAAKNIKIKKKPTSNSTAPLVQGIGFIIIAAGLVYCVLTNQLAVTVQAGAVVTPPAPGTADHATAVDGDRFGAVGLGLAIEAQRRYG